MARRFTPDVTPEEHAEYMRSAEARAERQATLRAELPAPIGRALRGRIRETVAGVVAPAPLPKDMIIDFGTRFAREGVIHDDQFTKSIPHFESPEEYQRYVEGANRANRRLRDDKGNREQALAAMKRQQNHVRDNVQRDVWAQKELSELWGASLHHNRKTIQQGDVPNERALLLSAAAIEDLGFALEESRSLGGVPNGVMFVNRLKQIGQYGAIYPESLLAHDPSLFLLAEREQERRQSYWGELLERYEQPEWGGNRRTAEMLTDEVINRDFITSLQVQ